MDNKSNDTRNQNICCFVFSAIGALVAFFIPFIAYLMAGTSLFINTKNNNKKLSIAITGFNIIVIVIAFICHMKQNVALK